MGLKHSNFFAHIPKIQVLSGLDFFCDLTSWLVHDCHLAVSAQSFRGVQIPGVSSLYKNISHVGLEPSRYNPLLNSVTSPKALSPGRAILGLSISR